MKKTRILVAVVCLICLFSIGASAQSSKTEKNSYKTGVGIKAFPFAVDLKSFFRERNRAIELIGYFNNGFRLTGLYEFHGDLNTKGNIKWYLGGGGHVGYYDKDGKDGVSSGVDAVAGFDYKFSKLPIALALDWQPSLEMTTPSFEFQPGFGGLAIRVAF